MVRFLVVILLLTLAACTGGNTSANPTVNSVVVTGPAGSNLKIGEAVQFVTVAKDSSNADILGKTFIWTSSDSNIASVSADGKVIAKRFGKVKITASVDGKSGETADQTTYGLEVVGGTTYRAFNPSFLTVATLIRFRPAPGSAQPVPDNTPVTVNVTGPSGWIGNTPQKAEFGFLANTPTWWDFGDGVAMSGAYTASATLGGANYSTSFSVDNSNTIPAPTGLNATAVSISSVSGAWTAPVGAALYHMSVNERDSGNQVTNGSGSIRTLTDQTQSTFGQITLNPTLIYSLAVQAANFNWRNTDMNVPAPAAFNLSRARQEFTLLQLVGGVRVQGGGNDTVISYRFHKPDGSAANSSMNLSVIGSSGWNGGKPFTFSTSYLGAIVGWIQPAWFGSAIAPISGSYSYSAVIGATTYSGSFTLDSSQTLPDPTSLTVTAASTSSVACSWAAVPGAQSYSYEVWNDTDKRTEGNLQYVTSTSATSSGLSLSASKTYFCQIHSMSNNMTTVPTVGFANQNNFSFRRTQITLP